jgi:hypothetical protein
MTAKDVETIIWLVYKQNAVPFDNAEHFGNMPFQDFFIRCVERLFTDYERHGHS